MSLLKIGDAARLLNVKRLREVLDYDPATGLFRWRIQPAARFNVGDIAGTIRKDGYCSIEIDGHLYLAHRLAWFYFYGKWPDGELDHRHGKEAGNGIANLRELTHQENQQNRRRAHKTNKTGLLGVSKWRHLFAATINANKKRYHLGYFKTAEEAHAAYLEAKRRLHHSGTL